MIVLCLNAQVQRDRDVCRINGSRRIEWMVTLVNQGARALSDHSGRSPSIELPIFNDYIPALFCIARIECLQSDNFTDEENG